MNLTIIIPTYNRTADLQRLLESIFQQSFPVPEVLAIVGPGDQESLELVRKWKTSEPSLKSISATRKSLVHAINLGLANATGDVICLLDDDVWLPPGWAARIAKAYQSDPQLGAYGGRDKLQLNDSELNNPPLAKKVGQFRWDGMLAGNHHCGSVKSPLLVDVIKGCNLSFRRAAFPGMQVEPALESKGAEIGTEIDICQRIIRAGYHIVYDNENCVLHFASPRSSSDDRSNLFSPAWGDRTFNEGLVVAKHRPLSALLLLGLRFFVVGTRMQPGILRALILLPKHPSWQLLSLPWQYTRLFMKGAAQGLRKR